MTTSYNGWPASKDPRAIGIDPTWAPLGHRFPGGVKAGDVAVIFMYLVLQLDARVEPIDRDAIKDEWGWFFKMSANSPALVSCHASGTGIDYNATRHPNGVHKTWSPLQVVAIHTILAELDGVVRWLGDATGTIDAMHFEIRKGVEAKVAQVAARLRRGTIVPGSVPTPPIPTASELEIFMNLPSTMNGLAEMAYMTVLGRRPKDVEERNGAVAVINAAGYDVLVADMWNSVEARRRRGEKV